MERRLVDIATPKALLASARLDGLDLTFPHLVTIREQPKAALPLASLRRIGDTSCDRKGQLLKSRPALKASC